MPTSVCSQPVRRASASVPADYGEVFERHMEMIYKLVSNLGILVEEREDVSSELLTKFIEKDGLVKYDPERTTTKIWTTGKVVTSTASFATMLRGFVMCYVRHQRDRQNVRLSRESLRLDEPLEEGEVEALSHLLRAQDHADEVIAKTDAGRLLVACRKHLTGLSWLPERSLADVFDAMALAHTQHDRITVELVSTMLQVPRSRASVGIRRVRAALAEIV